jgi:ABC-type multidrug transport system ATPase subunit
MEIRLENIGKKFNTEWIFRNVSFTFEADAASAILGRNGSGKSTLLQVVAGNLHPTSGCVTYTLGGKTIPDAEIFRYLSLVAPYQELIEEFTLAEMLRFHFAFKPILHGYSVARITGMLGFGNINHKHIRQFSSGMRQRVKLVTAIFSDVPLLLLDEPTMNLDQAGIDWYLELIHEFTKNRTVIICSNQHQTESGFARKSLQIEDYKK